MNGWFSFVPYWKHESRNDCYYSAKPDCFLSCFFVFIHSTKAACFLCRLIVFVQSRKLALLFSWKIAILQSCFQVFKTAFFPSAFRCIFPSIHIAFYLKSGTNKRRKVTRFEKCPQMSPFVLISPLRKWLSPTSEAIFSRFFLSGWGAVRLFTATRRYHPHRAR